MSVERLAIIINPALPTGLIANTAATIGVGLGALAPQLGARQLTDLQGRSIHNSADRAVPILQAEAATMRDVLMKALPPPDGGFLVAFPQFARTIHSFSEYQSLFPQKDLAEELIEGIGLAGPDKWVRSLTGHLKLLR